MWVWMCVLRRVERRRRRRRRSRRKWWRECKVKYLLLRFRGLFTYSTEILLQ